MSAEAASCVFKYNCLQKTNLTYLNYFLERRKKL